MASLRSDLFDDDEDDCVAPPKKNNDSSLSDELYGTISASPGASPQTALLVSNSNHQELIRGKALQFGEKIVFLNTIVSAVLTLSKYVPPEAKKLPVWQNEILPAMSTALVENVKICNGFNTTISNIRGIAIALRKDAELLQKTRGSDEAITIIDKHLDNVFGRLDQTKTQLKALDLGVLNVFKNNADTILGLLGSKAAEGWLENVKSYQQQIRSLRTDLERLEMEQNCLIGALQGLNNYLVALHSAVNRRSQAVQEMKSRVGALQGEIDSTTRRMEAIPATVVRPVTVTTSSGWFFWHRRQTQTYNEVVANPNREVEVNFLKGITASRQESVRDLKQGQDQEEAKRAEVEREIRRVTEEYETKKKALDSFLSVDGAKHKEMASVIKSITEFEIKIAEVEVEAKKAQTKFGLRGDVLVRFLAEADGFLKECHGNAQVLTPLIGFIENIQEHFFADREFFRAQAQKPSSSKKIANVYAAGQGMLKEIGLLDGAAKALEKLAEPSEREQYIKLLREGKTEEAVKALEYQ